MNEKKVMLWCFAGIGVVVVLAAGIGLMVTGFGSGGSETPRIYTSRELLTEFENDEAMAKKRFIGKKIRVSGTIVWVERGKVLGSSWVALEERGDKGLSFQVVGELPGGVSVPRRGESVELHGTVDHLKPVGVDFAGSVFIRNCTVR